MWLILLITSEIADPGRGRSRLRVEGGLRGGDLLDEGWNSCSGKRLHDLASSQTGCEAMVDRDELKRPHTAAYRQDTGVCPELSTLG